MSYPCVDPLTNSPVVRAGERLRRADAEHASRRRLLWPGRHRLHLLPWRARRDALIGGDADRGDYAPNSAGPE